MNEIILTSSALILFIAVLRRVFRGKITPSLQYAIWLLVALRLLIPGTLFSAPVSIVGLAEDVRSAVSDAADEGVTPAPEFSAPIYIPEQVITIMPDATSKPDIPAVDPTPAPQEPVPPTAQSFSVDWLDVIWKAGIAAVGAAFLGSNLVYYRKLRRTRRRIPTDQLPVACPIPVYYVRDLGSPCLFCNAIYVNQKALHNDRLRHVIIHELTHRRHGDPLWTLLRCACLAIHWYNPLVWWAAHLSRRDCELSCDSAVLRTLGDTTGISYGETLMAMLTASSSNLLHAATTMSASKRTMAERLKLIVRRPKMMKLTAAALALVTVCAVILTFGGCADETADPAPDPTVTTPGETDPGDSTHSSNEDAEGGEKLDPPDGGFGYIPSPVYSHPSGLFSMKLPDNWQESILTVETEDGVLFYDAELYQLGTDSSWIASVHPQPADWNFTESEATLLATFDPNGTPQNYILEYNQDHREQYDDLLTWIRESFTLTATPEQFSRLIHDNYAENIALAVCYLPYLSWRNYREVYGEDAMVELLSALWQFADAGSATWDQYHDMLSITNDGLDGAYSEGLSSVFEALYLRNSQQFLSVINSIYITDAERARVAAYVKYGLGSEPSEDDSEDVVFDDTQVIMGLARAYGPTVYSTGSPEHLTLTLTGDWTLDGIRTALFQALCDHLSGTLLDGDLTAIEISYSFRFPEEMHDGVTFTVAYFAHYTDRDIHTLPSGASHSPSGRTNELTAAVQLVGDGITAPVDENFARGQAIYDLLAETAAIRETLSVSVKNDRFQLLETIGAIIDQKLTDAGLSGICSTTGMSCGGYYNPVWCDVGYEQTVEYTVTFLYTENNVSYPFTFSGIVTIITTE